MLKEVYVQLLECDTARVSEQIEALTARLRLRYPCLSIIYILCRQPCTKICLQAHAKERLGCNSVCSFTDRGYD